MGREKQTIVTQGSSTTTPTPTAEETALNKLQLEEFQASSPARRALTQSGLNLGNLLLTGQPLPGFLSGLPGGISPEVTTSITDQALRDVNTQLAASGAGTFLESGASQAIGARTAGDIRNQAAQFNLQQLAQLLNLATGQGQAVPLGFQSNLSGQLGGQLAGLRSTRTETLGNQSTYQMNPFLKSFYQSAGTGFGTATPKVFGF
jgi:hypothetical protein